jgi:TPR repeat protein
MHELFKAYMTGDGVAQDAATAVRWLKKAAELGYAEAQADLADVLRKIDGNPNEAFYWDKKAAEQGFARSQHNLGICFKKGIGTPVNHEMSIFWYQKAEQNGITYK